MRVAVAVVALAGMAEARPIRRLNGMNNTVPVRLNGYDELDRRVRASFAALEIPETRFHDPVIGSNCGVDLVDVSRIFPLFHLDENDPKNYNFGPTDEYVEMARQYGGEIEFRFGEQIEGGKVARRIRPPTDIGKWARICLNIARHYNAGWGDGFRHGIRRFSVWEEPDNDRLLDGSTAGAYEECYLPMYAALARLLKAEWPEAHVGGPNTMGVCPKLETFLDYCKTNALPLDFCAVTVYAGDPAALGTAARRLREQLDRRGFTATETEFSEWHYSSNLCFYDPETFDRYVEDLTGLDSAAFTAATLALMQDEPIDHMFFYAANVNYFGIFDSLCCRPRPPYYALRDFAIMARGERLEMPVSPAAGVYCLASRLPDASAVLQLTLFKHPGGDVSVALPPGWEPTEVRLLPRHGDTACETGWTFADGKLRLSATVGSSVRLVRLVRESGVTHLKRHPLGDFGRPT